MEAISAKAAHEDKAAQDEARDRDERKAWRSAHKNPKTWEGR